MLSSWKILVSRFRVRTFHANLIGLHVLLHWKHLGRIYFAVSPA